MFPKFSGAVTVGERGQIVIPAEVRNQLQIKPGDKLLIFTRNGSSDSLIATKADKFEERAKYMYHQIMPLTNNVKKDLE